MCPKRAAPTPTYPRVPRTSPQLPCPQHILTPPAPAHIRPPTSKPTTLPPLELLSVLAPLRAVLACLRVCLVAR